MSSVLSERTQRPDLERGPTSSPRNGGGRNPQALKIGAGTERPPCHSNSHTSSPRTGPRPTQPAPRLGGPQGSPENQPQLRRSHHLRSSGPSPTPQPEVCAHYNDGGTEGQPVLGRRGAWSCRGFCGPTLPREAVPVLSLTIPSTLWTLTSPLHG